MFYFQTVDWLLWTTVDLFAGGVWEDEQSDFEYEKDGWSLMRNLWLEEERLKQTATDLSYKRQIGRAHV